MTGPKPYGLHSYGDQLTEGDLSFIDHQAKKVSNLKVVHQLESIKYTRELPDGGFVILIDMGGVFRAITYKQPILEPLERNLDGMAHMQIPMLFSGVFKKHDWLRNGEGAELRLTQQCARRLGGYVEEVGRDHKLQKFRVPYSPYFQELKPDIAKYSDDDTLMFTQYGKHASTWYSGAMAEVMQIVAGYGRQDRDQLPQDNLIEQAVFKIPAGIAEQIESELDGYTLPGYMGVPPEDGCFQFNYSFHNTDLVAFDTNVEPWLIKVNSSGVWAMPLPVIPATTSELFQAYVAEMGDEELMKILDRFKGIPSGEGFPMAPSEFYDWVRAGVIIKVCDTADFYQHSPYTSACGWSCNTDGTHLVNTCYDYLNNLCHGFFYQIKLNLGTAKNRGWIEKKNLGELNNGQAAQVGRYIGELNQYIGSTGHLASLLRYKLRRVDVSEILSRSHRSADDGEVDYWRNYELDPIASHSGNTNIASRGYLYGGTPVKLPEPFIKGCMSLVFLPEDQRIPIVEFPRIDTVVFAYFIEDDLKVIKNFHDERKFYREVQGNFEDVMYVGAWEETETFGLTGLSGTYYTTDFDDRREVSEGTKHTKIVGKDLSYSSPKFIWPNVFWMDGHIVRHRYVERTYYITTNNYDRGLEVATIVPYLNRNALLYAKKDYVNGSSNHYEEYNVRISIVDPNWYSMWTVSPARWFSGGMSVEWYGTKWRSNKPYPVDGNPIWVEKLIYQGLTPQNEFADEGDWLAGGSFPMDVYGLSRMPETEPNVASYYNEIKNPEAEPEYQLWGSILPVVFKISDKPHNQLYYEPSPHPDHGNVVYEDACKVMFGTMQYANMSYGISDRKAFGHTSLADRTKCDVFFGVINE